MLGVVPYLKVDIEDEDSLSTRLDAGKTVHPLDAAILRLPHISNFTDFMPLEQHPLLGVRYVQNTRQLGTPDLIILPGTKNTVDDLLWLRQSGLEAALLKLAANGTPVLGVCGGYQMLGEMLAARDRMRRTDGALDVQTASAPGEGFEDWVLLKDTLTRLPSPYAQVLWLRFGQGWSQARLAERFGVGQPQISRWERKGKELLRQALDFDPSC